MVPEVMTYVCPFCDCEVRVGKPCRGCAKKVRNDSSQDGLDLPDDDFDYDAFVAREFGKAPHQVLGIKWYWWLLAVVMLVAMAWVALTVG